VVSDAHRGQPAAREPVEEAFVRQQRGEHFDIPGRFGEDLDGNLLVGHSD
jgi:hypothetical protein